MAHADSPPEGPGPLWTLQREPDEVPTPVAVAVADFCRRAGRPSSADDIRLALARLDPAHDVRVLEVARGDPPAKPLGPHALVDALLGLSFAEAAERDDHGYYVAAALAQRARPQWSPADPQARARVGQADLTPGPPLDKADETAILDAYRRGRGSAEKAASLLGMTREALEKRVRALSLVRRVASLQRGAASGPVPPRVRSGPPPPPQPHVLAPPAQLPKRGAGRPPMGRMAQGKPARRDLGELERSAGKDELLRMVRSHGSSITGLVRRLKFLFASRRGEIDEARVRALLSRHGLTPELQRMQRDHLRDLIVRNRGDLRRVAKAVHLARGDLVDRLREHGLYEGAKTLRGRVRRELQERPLKERIHLVVQQASYVRELDAWDPLSGSVVSEVEQRLPGLRGLAEADRAGRLQAGLGLDGEAAASLAKLFEDAD